MADEQPTTEVIFSAVRQDPENPFLIFKLDTIKVGNEVSVGGKKRMLWTSWSSPDESPVYVHVPRWSGAGTPPERTYYFAEAFEQAARLVREQETSLLQNPQKEEKPSGW